MVEGSPPDTWTPWAPRAEVAPTTEFRDSTWIIRENGKPSRHGGWDLNWATIEPGTWYRFEVDCDAKDINSIQDQAHAELIFWGGGGAEGRRVSWSHVRFEKRDGGGARFFVEAQAPENAKSATARLMLRWADHGELVWSKPSLTQIEAPAARKLKVAIATNKPPGTSVADNLAFALRLVRKAKDAGADVVCLPEVILSWRVKTEPHEGARPIPGPETEQLLAAAKELEIDIVLSMNELDEHGLIYNTGLYFDQNRGLTGKYRKVHLAVGERWRGVTPGVEFPVWETSYGKAGMLICYDNVHPEGHRILSQKGAELLFLPIMGDPRAIGDRGFDKWVQIMSVRAMDNHVWMVVCQNNGDRGVIVRPDGEIVAEVNPDTGFAITEIDLNFRYESTIGSDFENRNWAERRPALYRELVEDR